MREETLAGKQMRVNNGRFMTGAEAISRLDRLFDSLYRIEDIIFI